MSILNNIRFYLKAVSLTASEQILDIDKRNRELLVKKYQLLIADLNEFTKHPVETISVLDISRDIDICITEIRRLDFLIGKRYYDIVSDKIQDLTRIALTKENEVNKTFTSADCPKISQSLFEHPFI